MKRASKKIKKNTPTKKITPDHYQELIKRPETLVGAAVIGAVLVIVLLRSFFNPILFSSVVAPILTNSASMSQKESITLDSLTATESATPAMTATSAAIATPSATPVSAVKIKVKKDQTFWELAKRYCGSHTFAETLATNNGYASVSKLREGDVVTINCSR